MNFKLILFVTLAVLGVVSLWLFFSYRSDMNAAKSRIEQSAKYAETLCGVVQYAEQGSGQPVLVIHGAGGGFDQGLLLGRWMVGDDFRLIAPSRFGYLAPVPERNSAEQQADAYRCLLDNLGIERVSVVAISAGGLSGLAFAQKYPSRTDSLILISAMAFTDDTTTSEGQRVSRINQLIANDFTYWVLVKYFPKRTARLFGVPRENQQGLTAQQDHRLKAVLRTMSPLSRRIEGVLNDQSQRFPRSYPIDEIKAPTLIIHAKDDSLVLMKHPRHSADHIPEAELMVLERGGHFLVGMHDVVKAKTDKWIKSSIFAPQNLTDR